jgi:hypothetical protein
VGLGGLVGGRRGEVVVQRGAERVGDLGGGSGEEDSVAAARDGVDGEALLLKPGLGGSQVGVGDAKLGGVLVGGDPAVVEGGGGILLSGNEGVERGLLRGAAAEEQRDAVELEGRGDGADVVCGAGAGRTRAGEGDAAGGVNLRGDAGARAGLRGGGRGGAEGKSGGRGEKRKEAMDRATFHEGPDSDVCDALQWRGKRRACRERGPVSAMECCYWRRLWLEIRLQPNGGVLRKSTSVVKLCITWWIEASIVGIGRKILSIRI